MRTSLTRTGLIVAAATSLALGLAACSADSDPDATPARATEAVLEEQPGDTVTTIAATDADPAFDLERDTTVEVVEQTFATDNASAVWEMDTLVVTMDGDAESPTDGFTTCRVLREVVDEGDSVALVFPNGRLECTEVLPD